MDKELLEQIDATYLKFGLDAESFIRTVNKYGFKQYCVNPRELKHCIKRGSTAASVAVFNFPFASSTIESVIKDMEKFEKYYEEADIVIPSLAKSEYLGFDYEGLELLRKRFKNKILKVIIEDDLLNSFDSEITTRCQSLVTLGYDFLKTFTGYGNRGVLVEDIEKIKSATLGLIEIKASGGIKTYKQLKELNEAGATRFGIGIENACRIIDEIKNEKN